MFTLIDNNISPSQLSKQKKTNPIKSSKSVRLQNCLYFKILISYGLHGGQEASRFQLIVLHVLVWF